MFSLKTTPQVGDPAYGGVIGCLNTGTNPRTFDLIVTTTSIAGPGIQWGPTNRTTSATSQTDGVGNSNKIINCLTLGSGTACTAGSNILPSQYAAGLCSTYNAPGGYQETGSWFLPSGGGNNATNNQMNCLYANKTAVEAGSIAAGGSDYIAANYWSSTELNLMNAWSRNLYTGGVGGADTKSTSSNRQVRCVRAFN